VQFRFLNFGAPIFLHQPDFLVGKLGPRRVGSESGGSGSRRKVGSSSCGSIIGRECYESWVDSDFKLLSSHVTSSFHSDVPKYRGPPSSIKAVFGVPNRTVSNLKKKKKIQKLKIHEVQRR